MVPGPVQGGVDPLVRAWHKVHSYRASDSARRFPVLARRVYSRGVALQRMQQVGAFLTTAEQVTFQLLVSADHPK